MAATKAPMSVTLPSLVIMPAPGEDEGNRVNGGNSGAALKSLCVEKSRQYAGIAARCLWRVTGDKGRAP